MLKSLTKAFRPFQTRPLDTRLPTLPLLPLAEIMALQRTAHCLKNNHIDSQTRYGNVANGGELTSKKRGQGMELVDIRAYQLGDDVRHIDWHTTAKRGRAYSKVFAEEVGQETCLFLQHDATMFFATQGELKVTTALRCAALLAFHAQQRHSPVGGWQLRNKLQYFPVSKQAMSVMHFIQQCARHNSPAIKHNQVAFHTALQTLNQDTKIHSHVVVICNFSQGLEAKTQTAFRALKQRHRLTVIQIMDAFDASLPHAERLDLYTETQGHFSINTHDVKYRRHYAAHMAEKKAATETFFYGLGAALVFVHTHKDVAKQLSLVV